MKYNIIYDFNDSDRNKLRKREAQIEFRITRIKLYNKLKYIEIRFSMTIYNNLIYIDNIHWYMKKFIPFIYDMIKYKKLIYLHILKLIYLIKLFWLYIIDI